MINFEQTVYIYYMRDNKLNYIFSLAVCSVSVIGKIERTSSLRLKESLEGR